MSCCYTVYYVTLNTDATGNLGVDRQKYSSTFEKERVGPNVMQYSSRNQARETLGMENSDPYTRPQYKMNADLSIGRTTTGVNRNRSEVLSQVKSSNDKVIDSNRSATSKMGDSRYPDNPQTFSSQNPYSRRGEIFPGSDRDPLTLGSGNDKQYPPAVGYENTRMTRDRDRQTPSASYSSSRENYPNASEYGSRERNPPSTGVGAAQSRVGATAKKLSSPGEEDLRRSLYDKRYQAEVEAAVQKRQTQVLGDYKSHLSQRERGELERAPDRRLDSGRGRYDAGNADRIEAADRRLRDAEHTKLSSATVAATRKLDQRRDIDIPSARKPFTNTDIGGKVSGIDRSRWQTDVNETPIPRSANKLKEDYYRDDHQDRELTSGRRVQDLTAKGRQPASGTSARERSRQQQQNERNLAEDSNRQTGLINSSSRKSADGRQTGKQESSSSLLRMKEDLFRDQAKLDRQLRVNAEVSDERMERSDNIMRYDRERSLNFYDTKSGRSESRSSYAAEDRPVMLILL